MPEIEINNSAVAADAHLIEMQNAVMLEHGGVVTKLTFDSVEEMTLEAFKEYVVPKIGAPQDDLTIVRDSASGSYSFILGDRVTRYKVTGVKECMLDDVVLMLRTNSNKDDKYNMPVPLIRDLITNAHRVTTAAFPSEKRQYKYLGKTYTIYIPPTWFAIEIVGDVVKENRMCAVSTGWSAVFENTILDMWPLGNVWDRGHVCMGSSEVETDMLDAKMNITDMLIQHREHVLGFDANNDLTHQFESLDYLKKIDDIYKDMVSHKQIEAAHSPTRREHSYMLNMLAILSHPDGWKRVPYLKLNNTPERFTS